MFTWKCPPGNETDTGVCSITAVSSCMDRAQSFNVPYDIAMYQGTGSDVTLSLVRGATGTMSERHQCLDDTRTLHARYLTERCNMR